MFRLTEVVTISNGDTLGLEYAGTFVGSVILILFMVMVILTGMGMATLSGFSAPVFTLLAFVVMMATVQVFGTDVLKALGKYRQRTPSVVIENPDDIREREEN